MARPLSARDEQVIARLRARLEEAGDEVVVGEAIGPALWPRVLRVADAVCARELRGSDVTHRVRCDAETNPAGLGRAGGVGFEVALRFPARAEWVVIRVVRTDEPGA